MRLTFPHMGLLSIPVETLLNGLGHEAVPAPPTNKRTFELGAKYSPEGACLPFKINLGNYIEAFEQGAEGILMARGLGPCRFGYYAQIQRRILEDLGYNFQLLLLEPFGGERQELYRTLRVLLENVSLYQAAAVLRLAWEKIRWVDQGNALLRFYLPRSKDKVKAERSYEHFLAEMRREDKIGRLRFHYRQLETALKSNLLPMDEPPLRVKMIGEIYMVLEPRVNFHLEMLLGEMGVEVVRTMSISQWAEEHLLGFLYPFHKRRTVLLSAPYLPSFVGGHGRETIAEMVDARGKPVGRGDSSPPLHLHAGDCGPEYYAGGEYGIPNPHLDSGYRRTLCGGGNYDPSGGFCRSDAAQTGERRGKEGTPRRPGLSAGFWFEGRLERQIFAGGYVYFKIALRANRGWPFAAGLGPGEGPA